MHGPSPTPRLERSAGIDIARGFALLGIILVNARFFFLPLGSAIDAGPLPGDLERSTRDWLVHDAIDALATYKFISLFSLLFGFGLAQQAARAAAAGASRWVTGLRRLGLMLVIGVVHGVFVWYGDVLSLYALLGTAVLACIALPDRWLRRVTAGAMAAMLLLSLGGVAMQWAFADLAERSEAAAAAPDPSMGDGATSTEAEAPGPAETSEDARGLDAMVASGLNPFGMTWVNAETRAFREGPWTDALAFRSVGFALGLLAAPFDHGLHAFVMMLIGVWAQRSGVFGTEASARRRRLARRLLVIGLPIAVCGVVPLWVMGREGVAANALADLGTKLGGLVLPVGYACLAIEFGPRLPAMLRAPVQAAGAIGLTVYLSESVACTAIASWWGLARFGTMTDAEFTVLAACVWAALAVAALAWTRTVGNGPMERLWRWGTYGSRPA